MTHADNDDDQANYPRLWLCSTLVSSINSLDDAKGRGCGRVGAGVHVLCLTGRAWLGGPVPTTNVFFVYGDAMVKRRGST